MIRKFVPEHKKRLNNSSLVRIGNDYIKIAVKLQKDKKIKSIGEVFEQSVLCYKNSIKIIGTVALCTGVMGSTWS